jgi:hypothetical protein
MESSIFLSRDVHPRDPALEDALARIYDDGTPALPVRTGGSKCTSPSIAVLGQADTDTGPPHHATYVPRAFPESGLGVIGESIIERSPESVELRVDFRWRVCQGLRERQRRMAEITAPRHRMSLRAVGTFSNGRVSIAGIPGWRKRTQGVCKISGNRGRDRIKAGLSERLYVPESFREESKARSPSDGGAGRGPSCPRRCPVQDGLVQGEYKTEKTSPSDTQGMAQART